MVIARVFFPLAAMLGLLASPAWAATWRADPERSRLGFAGTQAGSPFEGTFATFPATIHFDEADLAASKVVVVIDMASARTGNAQRDDALKGQDWFAVATYPQGRFETNGFRRLDGNRYEAQAVLTIRGAAKPVALPFTLERTDSGTRAMGELVIDRTEFGVGQGQWASPQWVGHDVTIRFDLLATPPK